MLENSDFPNICAEFDFLILIKYLEELDINLNKICNNFTPIQMAAKYNSINTYN